MKLLLIVLTVTALAGCEKPMTNDEVIAETRKCTDAGLRAQSYQNLAYYTTRIQCLPKKEQL